jgi:RNA polymerase sigma-70 factor, ECF subfamily
MDITTSPSLLQRLRIEGNERDWEVFFSLYARPVFGLAQHFGLTPDQAEDVVQETMVALMRKLPEFRYDPERARFRTWIWRVVRNISITHWRRAQRRAAVSLDAEESGGILSALATDDAGGSAEVERAWRLALVREGLRMLEADTRLRSQTLAIFKELMLGGRDAEEIAAQFGVRRNVVDVIRVRLTQRLGKIVAALESGELKPLTEPEPDVEPEPREEML